MKTQIYFFLFYSKGCGYVYVDMYSPNLLPLALEYSVHIPDYLLVIFTCLSHGHLNFTGFMIELTSLSSKPSSPLCFVSSKISGKTKLNRKGIWNSSSVLSPSILYLCHPDGHLITSSKCTFHLLFSAIEYFKYRIIYRFV